MALPPPFSLPRRKLLACGIALCAPAALTGRPALAAPPAQATPRGTTATAAPVHPLTVGLRVRDPEAVATWYEAVLGLQRLPGAGPGTILLGTPEQPLLDLIGDPGLRLARRNEAGLYHTAFLLPERRDLGLWIRHAIGQRIPVDGVADHLVSEAIYLTDPEGNGVEIYADRAPADWRWQGDQIVMGTEALDVEALLALEPLLPELWRGAPAGTRIGHVHLKVGAADRAAAFWQDELGFDAVSQRPEAVFLSTGGYHHHIAANSWESRAAPPRDGGATGLAYVLLGDRRGGAARSLQDPWGTEIRLQPL